EGAIAVARGGRRAMIDAGYRLSITRQCLLLGLPRSTAYYRPQPVSQGDVDLMNRIDAIGLERPFLGTRRMVDALGDDGWDVNRKRVQRLMRIMGIAALYLKPRTSRPADGHQIYPYLGAPPACGGLRG